jgi:nitrous oxidase accessory protein NosD
MIQKPAGQVEKANRAVEPVSSREGEDIAIFNSYFPDDLEAGKKLDEWWKNKDSTYLDDDSFFDLFRRGIRRCSIQYKDNFLMQYIGGKYVWHKQPNDPKALDIIYHASFGPGEYKYYAVYSGLSVANPKSEKVLKRLVELALEPHQLDRIIWGVKGFNQADEFIKLLQPYLNSSDLEIRKRAETVIKELEGKAAGQDEEKDIKTETVQKDLQKLIASAKIGETVTIPKGLYTEPVVIDKPLTLKGEDANNCVIEVTADKPAVFVDTKGKGKVTIEGLTIKWQLATSDKNIENPFAVLVKDSKADFNNCTFLPLGNYQRSPAALRASGFTNMTVSNCRFEGYGYTVQFGEGTSGTIQDSIVTNSGHQGISLYEGANVKIVGNIVAGSLYHGIRSTGGRLNARDNLIINNKNRGIYLGNKDASGVITNNIIMGNPEGISGFANSQVTITNNIFADSTYAGVDMRDSCRLNIRDNIFQNNQRAIMLVKETGRDNNMVSKNTFWKNKIIAENLEIKNRLEADPQFADADNGDFSLKAGPAQEQKQGLNEPNVFTRIWEKWKKLDVVKSDF